MPSAPPSLRELITSVGPLVVSTSGNIDAPITGVQFDSRRVRPGDLFVCVPGLRTDGHEYAGAAIAAGAAALCVERPLGSSTAEVVVRDARAALPLLAASFFGNPAERMLLLGVTGTNGKTTTAFLLESILRSAGHVTGLIGTIETRIAGQVRPGVRTTPESLELQQLFAEMVDAGVRAVAMEVTSHALVLHRVDATRFAAAGFTNLSQDHLDFHADMEDYFHAKRSLFVPERAVRGAINADDPYGRRLLSEAAIPCLSFGRAADADVRAEQIASGPSGSAFHMRTPVGDADLRTSLVGHFNVSNCLAAAAVALQADIALESVVAGIEGLRAVPGRFEAIDEGQPFTVVVDYAHTPDSLDNVLRAARPLAAAGAGKVSVVFGCGGDRDRGKRPLMGAVAARLADCVFVTSDNPRSEDPRSIIDQILEGVLAERRAGPDAILVDRKEAIYEAVTSARPGDVLVIAGKGHETGQEFADHTIPFDDRDVARAALKTLGWRARA